MYAPEKDEEIIRHFEDDPTSSINAVARQFGVSQWKVWHTVHSVGLYQYHLTPVQVLEEGDPVRREMI